jgi:hypothetical protein
MRKKLPIWLPLLVLGLSILACSMPGSISVEDQIRTQIVQTAENQPSNTPFVFEPSALSSLTPTSDATLTLTPTYTSTSTVVVIPTHTTIPSPSGTSKPCDVATFVMDVTVNDGEKFSPGQSFVKTWRLKNVGSCTWTTNYEAIFESGNHMSGPNDVNLTKEVAPGETIDISVNLVAPGSTGTYRGNWKLRNEDDEVFGLTSGGPFYVEIKVVNP